MGIMNYELGIRRLTFKLFTIVLFALFVIPYSLFTASASHCASSDYDCQISEIQREIDALSPAHENNKKELADLNSQLASLKKRIAALSTELTNVEKQIQGREEDLAYAREIFEAKAQNHYKFLRLYDPILPFLAAEDASDALREFNFRARASDEDRKTMEKYAEELAALRTDKETLEKNKKNLAAVQALVNERAKFLGGEVAKVEAYIATLSAKQQQILAQKLGSLNLPATLGAGPLYCTDDRSLNPGFSPAFAFYTYGIPHRVGMNQYGAYGRASIGQNHEEILRAYFDNFNFEIKPNINITVDGYGPMSLETYLLGIYEMPESWPLEALKAQAIAARSYALAYTNNGSGSICTTQKCQVYKQPHKSGNWKVAVEQTAGKVMVSGGQVIKAWYASTAGGYTFNSGDVWGSTTSYTKRMRDTVGGVGNFGDLQGTAYDKASPCFYAAQGWRSQYGKSAWLKSEEVADIGNVILLAKADPSISEHLYQTDKPHPYGGEIWDSDRVKQELNSRGISPIENAGEVSMSGVDWALGRTTQVTINGRNFDAAEFKNFFNLRAPANIQIVGPLFSVERK